MVSMLHFQSEFIGRPIIARYNAKECGKVHAIIVNHETGNILGISTGEKVVAIADIVAWLPKIEVLENTALVEPEEVVRIQNELQSEISILGNAVQTEKGQTLGKVIDFIIDIQKNALSSLHVAKNIFGIRNFDKRIIPAAQIIKMTKTHIIVKENMLKNRIVLKDLITTQGNLKPSDACLSVAEVRK